MSHGGLWHITQGFWHGVGARRTGILACCMECITQCCGTLSGVVLNVVWGVVVHPCVGSLKRRLMKKNPKEEVEV